MRSFEIFKRRLQRIGRGVALGLELRAQHQAGRVAALRSVADSNSLRQIEMNPSFVLMQYYGYLRRNPTDPPDADDSGYQFWLTKLNSFGGNFEQADMVKAFITSGEYRSRFR